MLFWIKLTFFLPSVDKFFVLHKFQPYFQSNKGYKLLHHKIQQLKPITRDFVWILKSSLDMSSFLCVYSIVSRSVNKIKATTSFWRIAALHVKENNFVDRNALSRFVNLILWSTKPQCNTLKKKWQIISASWRPSSNWQYFLY